MENSETLPQKVVDRKTAILKSRLDPNRARQVGENQKTSFFANHGFLKPRPEDISLVGFSKYYEPFIIIGGKYAVDYCKKHVFELKADNQVEKVFVGGAAFKFEPSNDGTCSKVLRLIGEEHSHYENETYFIMDRLLREASPEKTPMGPFEDETENPENFDPDFRNPRLSLDEEIDFIRSKIVKRPSDADVIVKEIFEITDRLTVYSPIYELSFKNVKDSKMVTALVDGITGKITIANFTEVSEKDVKTKKEDKKNLFNLKTKFFPENPKKETSINDLFNVEEPVNDLSQNTNLEKEINPPPNPEAESRFDVEKAITLAVDSMKRLGIKNKIQPLKVSPEGDSYMVELNLQDKMAKVQVNTKTREVKEYEIQELNS